MEKLRKILASLLVFMTVSLACVAQTATITDNTQFVIAKGSGSVNIRKAPNTKAAKVASMYADQTLPVLQEKDGWYQVMTYSGETGWVSATVCRINDAVLNADKVCDHVYGSSVSYEEYVEWYVSRVEGTDTWLAYTVASNTDEPFPTTWYGAVWKGRLVGNVLVFEEYVYTDLSYSSDDAKLELIDDQFDEDKGWRLRYCDKQTMPDNQGGRVFSLKSLTKDNVQKMFDGRQKKVMRLFLGPQLFAPKYANVEFG